MAKLPEHLREPSPRSKQVLAAVAEAFGSKPRYFYNFDEDESHQVDIARGDNLPYDGLTTHFTVTLNEHLNMLNGNEIPVEIFCVVAGPDGGGDIGNALSTCAFNCIKDGYMIFPGAVHPGVLAMYEGLSPNLQHIMFSYPMDWGSLSRIETDHGNVYTLQAIPISDAKFAFLRNNGFDALNAKFQEVELDYTSLLHESAI